MPDGHTGVAQHSVRCSCEVARDLVFKSLSLLVLGSPFTQMYPVSPRVQSAAARALARRLHRARGLPADGHQPRQGGDGPRLAIALPLERQAAGLQPAQAARAGGRHVPSQVHAGASQSAAARHQPQHATRGGASSCCALHRLRCWRSIPQGRSAIAHICRCHHYPPFCRVGACQLPAARLLCQARIRAVAMQALSPRAWAATCCNPGILTFTLVCHEPACGLNIVRGSQPKAHTDVPAGRAGAQDTVGAFRQLTLPSLSHFASNAHKYAEHKLTLQGAAVRLPSACFDNSGLATVSSSILLSALSALLSHEDC